MFMKKNGSVDGSMFHASLGIRVGIHTDGILGSGRRGIVCGTFYPRNAGLWRVFIMMRNSSEGIGRPGCPLPRISLNYGDNGMKTETKGTLAFGLHMRNGL